MMSFEGDGGTSGKVSSVRWECEAAGAASAASRLFFPGEEGDRSFRDLCDLSEADSEGGSVSPRGPLSSPHAPRGSPTPTNTPDAHDLNMNAAGAAAELSAAAERFITQQLSAVPPELELRPSSTGVGVGVWSKQSISRGTRYGPFLGKWTANAKDPSLAWEVSTLQQLSYVVPLPPPTNSLYLSGGLPAAAAPRGVF
ncbi:hypothetical protein O3P69_006768 [Scylla paramamosain]|uniref:Growth-regulating factor n=1 Tax=Scylla paramamosain TaxID=85552 RepID=A0AAW0U2F6_SCYPA